MIFNEHYALLFTDSLTSNLVFRFTSEMALNAMKIFAHHDVWMIILVASVANFCAYIINYIFGVVVFRILKPNPSDVDSHAAKLSHERINAFKNSKLIPLFLILAGVPFFGKFVLLFAGLIRLDFIKTIIVTSCAKIIYYIYFILIF